MHNAHIILRDDFEVSCPELDVLVEAALKVEKSFFGSVRGIKRCRMFNRSVAMARSYFQLTNKMGDASHVQRLFNRQADPKIPRLVVFFSIS